jgi:hypothetical protein
MKRTFFTPMAALMILTTSVVVAQSQEPYNPSSPGASPDSLTNTPRTPTSVAPMQRDSLQGDTLNRTPGTTGTTGTTPYQPMTPSERTTTPGTTRGGTSTTTTPGYQTPGTSHYQPGTSGTSGTMGTTGTGTSGYGTSGTTGTSGTSGAYGTTGRHRNLPKTAGPSPLVGMSGLVTLVTGMLLMRQRRKP